jgi:hypothetical protein
MKKLASDLYRAFSKDEVQVVKKRMKSCSPSLAIKKMQVKTRLRFHLTPLRMATIKNTKKQQILAGMW